MNIYKEKLKELEEAATKLAPNFESKAFNERTPREGEVANLVTAIRLRIELLELSYKEEELEEDLKELLRRIEELTLIK